MRAILVIGDGITDRLIQKLGGKTPLQIANKPAIDNLAKITSMRNDIAWNISKQ